MSLKCKKVLAVIAVMINILGWVSLVGAIKITGDWLFVSIFCFTVSVLLALPVVIACIQAKVAVLIEKSRR